MYDIDEDVWDSMLVEVLALKMIMASLLEATAK
jgi:hypothetical protein